MCAAYVCVFEVCPDGLLEDSHNPTERPEFVQCAVCERVYSSSYMRACMCAHDRLRARCACMYECESVIVTWLIHHG